MPCTVEEPATTVPAPQPPKEVVLPQICAAALAGQSCRQIAATFGLTKSTVKRWLQEMREDCPTRVAGCAEIVAAAVAGFWSLHDEALEAFRLSQADKATSSRLIVLRGPLANPRVITMTTRPLAVCRSVFWA